MWFLIAMLIIAMLFDHFGRAMLLAAISPLMDIVVCVVFIILLAVLLICEVAMMVIAPVALFCGYDSRKWHITLARKIMLTKLFGKSDTNES